MATDCRGVDADTEELATTVGLYVLGEISLGKAAERVGVTRWEMEEILVDNGIEPRLGPGDTAGATEEIDNVRNFE